MAAPLRAGDLFPVGPRAAGHQRNCVVVIVVVVTSREQRDDGNDNHRRQMGVTGNSPACIPSAARKSIAILGASPSWPDDWRTKPCRRERRDISPYSAASFACIFHRRALLR